MYHNSRNKHPKPAFPQKRMLICKPSTSTPLLIAMIVLQFFASYNP